MVFAYHILGNRAQRAEKGGHEYLPGISANRVPALFPGDAKTGARDAEVIARTAMGVPLSPGPVPEDETYRCPPTVPGVARGTATQLVLNVRVADFADHDHLASHCGLTPRNRWSGTSLNSASASRQGNKQLKNVLIFSCSSLLRSKGYFREYYDSRCFRGMTHRAALKATARKRMKVIYAMMRDRAPYRWELLQQRQTH